MKRSVLRIVLTSASALLFTPFATVAQTRDPSAVLHDVAAARLDHPTWTPAQVESALKPLLADMKTEELPDGEEIALALVRFFTFDGLGAKPIFEKYQNRDDLLGRVSWQSLQQMAFFGANDYDGVARRTKEFRTKYPAVPEDGEYTYNMVRPMARRLAMAGDHAGAVAMILEDVAALPADLPIRSFQLLGVNYASFQAVGKGGEALAAMKRHRDAMREALAQSPVPAGSTATPVPPAGTATIVHPEHRAGVLHLLPFSDLLYADLPTWTVDSGLRARRALDAARFDRWIAAIEAGQPIPIN